MCPSGRGRGGPHCPHPFVAWRLGDQLAARGIAMLDAPVSGGTERAATGELSIIVGGAKETFAACEDIFRAMGTNLFHVGTLGQGLAMKPRGGSQQRGWLRDLKVLERLAGVTVGAK